MNGKLYRYFVALVLAMVSAGVDAVAETPVTELIGRRLTGFVGGKDARIGVAVIIDGKDTVEVNGRRDFPMLSVYKFPQALAVADYCRKNGMTFGDTLNVSGSEIRENTYSPMRDRYGTSDLEITVRELLKYSVQQSDNNACDILFGLIGGTAVADSLMKDMGYEDIIIQSTENEMHQDIYLCYLNRSTPVAMAALMDRFDTVMRHLSPEYAELAEMMETCATGRDRLAVSLPSGAVLGHKTGTGDRNSQGRIIGLNDCGYVRLGNGRRYSIAVFVADSAYSIEETSSLIASVSAIVADALK